MVFTVKIFQDLMFVYFRGSWKDKKESGIGVNSLSCFTRSLVQFFPSVSSQFFLWLFPIYQWQIFLSFLPVWILFCLPQVFVTLFSSVIFLFPWPPWEKALIFQIQLTNGCLHSSWVMVCSNHLHLLTQGSSEMGFVWIDDTACWL